MFSSVILSVSDGVNPPVNLNPFDVEVKNLPPNITGVVLNDVTVKVGKLVSFQVNVTDELPFNLLDLDPQVANSIGFVSTAMVADIWNRVTIAPGFNETDYIWTARLTISDGVNEAVRLPSFKIHVVNLHPILYTNLSDINITVPNSIAINLNYSDPEGSPSTNMTLLGSNLNFIRLVLGKLVLINTTYLTPTTYYNGLQLVLTDGANTVNLPTFNVFINNTAP